MPRNSNMDRRRFLRQRFAQRLKGLRRWRPQPGGRKTIAQRFIAGYQRRRDQTSPARDERVVTAWQGISFAPGGAVDLWGHQLPTVKTVGYYLSSLRDGSERSLCADRCFKVGHRSISVGLLGEIAILTQQRLQWDPQNERFRNSDEANRMLQRSMRSPWQI